LQDGFIPSYFDTYYDLYRADRFAYISSTFPSGTVTPGWLSSLGLDLFNSGMKVQASLDAPFSWLPAGPSNNPADYPHVQARFSIDRNLIPHLSIVARYENFSLARKVVMFSAISQI